MARGTPCHQVRATNTSSAYVAANPVEQDRRLHVHLPAVALASAGGREVLRDPLPQRELEGRIAREAEGFDRGLGPGGLAPGRTGASCVRVVMARRV